MRQVLISRRVFIAATGAMGMATLAGCGLRENAGSGPGVDNSAARSPFIAYRLSTRGKRASNAARAHAANMLFVSHAAADAGRAHPGDKSAIVTLDLSEAKWNEHFGGGATEVDLRARPVVPCPPSRIAEQQALADKLAAATIEVPAKVGQDGKLFGSVTLVQLAIAVEQATGEQIDRRRLTLKDVIKTIGTFEATVTHSCIGPTTFRFEVVEE